MDLLIRYLSFLYYTERGSGVKVIFEKSEGKHAQRCMRRARVSGFALFSKVKNLPLSNILNSFSLK
jgi:hypothetical protein